jgi:hypothetical protein
VFFPLPLPLPVDYPQTIPFSYSCPIIIIILGLGSTNERDHMVFGFLSLIYLIQHDDLRFQTFSCRWHNFIFLYSWVTFPWNAMFSLYIHWLLGIWFQV